MSREDIQQEYEKAESLLEEAVKNLQRTLVRHREEEMSLRYVIERAKRNVLELRSQLQGCKVKDLPPIDT